MTPRDERMITQWGTQLRAPLSVKLYSTPDPRTQPLEKFCEDLQRLAPQVGIKRDDPMSDSLPSIDVGSGVAYRAVPEDQELKPFLDLLSAGVVSKESSEDKLSQMYPELELPAHFELFIASQCPYCPQTVMRMANYAREENLLKLTIVDSMLFDEISAQRRIRSVPTLVLDGDFRWSTIPPWAELYDVMANRDPSKLGAGALEDFLVDGRAPELADLMLKKGMVFPAYQELLTHSRWPTRLGAMVAFEYLAADNPTLATQVIDPLCHGFDDLAETIQGDVLQVLGTTGNSRVKPFLVSVAQGDYGEEVRTAARETLADLD